MNNYIDSHNHSLPNIDDGAKNLDMALAMLKVAYSDNISSIVLTPHHLNGAFTNNKEKLVEHFNQFKTEAESLIPEIELYLGSEVHLIDSSADEIISGKAMTYADKGKAALIELPKHGIPMGADKVLSQLIYNGITPVIAHPERNTQLRQDFSQLIEWIDMGCKSQLTAMSCEGKFGSKIQETSFKMIEEGLVHIIASDAHRPEGRSPKLSYAAELITKKYGTKIERLFFFENPQKLLLGEELLDVSPDLIKKPKKKRFLWF